MNDGSSILSGLAAARIASLTSFGTKKWNDCLMQLGDRAARLTVRVAARVHDCHVAMGELHLAAPARTLGGLRGSLDVSGRPPDLYTPALSPATLFSGIAHLLAVGGHLHGHLHTLSASGGGSSLLPPCHATLTSRPCGCSQGHLPLRGPFL